jgi:hypothetical protein
MEKAIERVTDNPYSYTTLSDELKANRDVVMTTVSTMGFMLYDMERFKADKKIVMAAVRNDGTAIQFASPELQEDKEVAMAAVRNNGSALHFLPAFKKEPELIKLAINHHYVPTKEQQAILVDHERQVMVEREQSSIALHKADAESESFDEFERGVKTNLKERYKNQEASNPTVGMLNNQGPEIGKKIMGKIRSYGAVDRGKYPAKNPFGGTRKRTKRSKRTKRR